MRRDRAPRDPSARLARLDRAFARRREVVRVAGRDWALDCLDDLDAVIDALVAELPGGTREVCPHFGVLWPSAAALCEHLAARGGLAGQRVLELGCGLALPSMLARRLGAAAVVATDRHPLTPLFLARNCAANGIAPIDYRPLDWRHPPALLGGFDLVLGSDLLYEAWQPGYLASLLRRVVVPGGEVLVADPGRRYLDRFVCLLEAEGFTCDLAAVRPTAHGSGVVEVLVLSGMAPNLPG